MVSNNKKTRIGGATAAPQLKNKTPMDNANKINDKAANRISEIAETATTSRNNNVEAEATVQQTTTDEATTTQEQTDQPTQTTTDPQITEEATRTGNRVRKVEAEQQTLAGSRNNPTKNDC